jgi:hypothetical protein
MGYDLANTELRGSSSCPFAWCCFRIIMPLQKCYAGLLPTTAHDGRDCLGRLPSLQAHRFLCGALSHWPSALFLFAPLFPLPPHVNHHQACQARRDRCKPVGNVFRVPRFLKLRARLHVFAGSSETPLTPLGILQAQKTRGALSDWPIDAVYASTLSRARGVSVLLDRQVALTACIDCGCHRGPSGGPL